MRKLLACLFVLTLLFCLTSCDKPEPTPEPEPPVIVDPLPEPEPEPEPDPTENYAKLTEEELAQLEAFRAEPKEPWGEQDLNVYSFSGELLNVPYKDDEPHGLSLTSESTTYRGIILGQDAAEAIEMLNLPYGAILIYTENENDYDATVIFYDQEIVDRLLIEKQYFNIQIYFNENFQVITDEKVLDFSQNGAGIKWAFGVAIYDGVVHRVGGSVMYFADYSEGGR